MVEKPNTMSEYPGPSEDVNDLHSEHMVLNMGPSHPATHGTTKFVLKLDGDSL